MYPVHVHSSAIPLFRLLGQSQPLSTRQLEAAQRGLLFWLLVTLICLVLIVCAMVIAIWRRQQRDAINAQRNQRSKRPHESPPSAWEVAGQRVATPDSESLEPAGQTLDGDNQGSPAPSPLPRPPRERPQPPGTVLPSVKSRPVALVTGAARRVGRAIALELARSGCDIVFTYFTSEDDATSLAKAISELGTDATAYRVDLEDPEHAQHFAKQLAVTLPRLDILVHNASLFGPSDINAFDVVDARRHLSVNTLAPLVLTMELQTLLEHSTLPHGGSVIAMTDIHAMARPRRNYAAYTMSKAALTEMVYCLARDLAPHIRVNGVAPGVVAWPEARDGAGDMSAADQAKYVRRIPLARAGDPDDAAKTVRWLALEASYVTGQIIRVDGGRWLT